MASTTTTREILGNRCGDVRCTSLADRTVVWADPTGALVEVTYECRAHAVESATIPDVLPGARVSAVFAGLRDIRI
jgi:hypothetical protein